MVTDRCVNIVLPLDNPARDSDLDAFVKATFPQVTETSVLESDPAILEIKYRDQEDINDAIYEAVAQKFFPNGYPESDEDDSDDGEPVL